MFTLKRVFVFLAEHINQPHKLEISCTIVQCEKFLIQIDRNKKNV